MRYLILGILILNSILSSSQSTKLDSLNQKIAKAKSIDTNYIKLLIEKSIIFIKENNILAKEIAFQSLNEAEKIKSSFFTAKATRLIGDVYLNVEPVNYDSCQYYYKTAVNLFSKINEKNVLPEIFFNIGLSGYYKGDTSFCYLNFDNGIKVAREINDISNLIMILRSKGAIKQNTSNYFAAIGLFNEALILSKKQKDLNNQILLLTDLSTVYFILSRYKESINYALTVLELNKNAADKLNDVICYSSIALSYKKLFDFKAAEKYFLKAISLTTTIKDKTDRNLQLMTLHMLLGNLYNNINNYTKADSLYKITKTYLSNSRLPNDYTNYYVNRSINDYDMGNISLAFQALDSALKYAVKSQSSRNIGRVYQRKAEVILSEIEKSKFKLGNNINNLKNALDSSLLIAKQTSDAELEFFSVKSLSKLYWLLGNYKQAYLYKDSASILSDSLFSEQKRVETQNTIFNFELEKQQVENKFKLEKEVQKRNISFLLGSFIIVLLVLAFLLYKRRRDTAQIKNNLLNKAKTIETEMKLLRLQLNPHFLFNSLNSIADYIRKNNTDKADYYLVKFAKLMRSTLESSEAKEISLSEELKMIELYIQLESMRLSNKLHLNIQIPDDINVEELVVPPLILQPFVENSIWHGLAKKEGEGIISIEIKMETDMITIYVDDNGVGRKNTQVNTQGRKSFGLTLTQERIELLNKMKNTKASVTLIDLAQGTRVQLQLPLIRA